MIIYNVTVNVEAEICNDWEHWMRTVHIPQVLATGLFNGHKFCKIISRQPGETGTTYAIQYFLTNIENYENYRDNYAPALQQLTLEKYGNRLYAFRTLLQEI